MDYKAVIADFANGTLDSQSWIVIFDNDGGYWDYCGPVPDFSDVDDPLAAEERWLDTERGRKEMKYGSPGGYQDIVELANDAGIPSEWC